MTTQMMKWAASVVVAVLVLTPAGAQATLLVDGGFESGTPVAGGVGGWEPFNGAAFTMDAAHSGDWSMGLFTTNNVPGAFQAVPASPGEVFTVTGWAMTPAALAGTPAFGGVQLSYFDIGGGNLGTVETGAGNAAADLRGLDVNQPLLADFAAVGQWEFLSVSGTAPAGTVKVQAFPIYIEFSGNTQGIYVDDMTLTPEPTSFALLAFAGAMAIRRRR